MSSCTYAGPNHPRLLRDRHADDCPDYETCPGCLPCTEAHCRVCNYAHTDGTCAECLTDTRDDLREIARMCDALPEEVEHRGVDGEAMTLLGPAADPERRGHLEASVLAGRVPADYLEHADGELHPLFVLGTWDGMWRDALEHDDPAGPVTVAGATDYLDRTMTYMASYEHVPFEDFARDLRRCRRHMEAVLHDGEQIERGAPCLACRGPNLVLRYGDTFATDRWTCPRRDCGAEYTRAQYRGMVEADARAKASHLTDRDMEARTGVKAGTVREWARRGYVGKRREHERTVYSVEDVLTRNATNAQTA